MKFDVSAPIIAPSNNPEKRIICSVWSPDGERLAVATADRCITLVKAATGELSRFQLKAKDENATRAFAITGVAWAPDSCRFAVAQSDAAVAVYDVGSAQSSDSRKKILLRFAHKSPAICVAWPVGSSNDFVYGLGDGQLLCGLTKMKKSEELYRHSCSPVSIASAVRNNAVTIGHLDGNIFVVNLDTRSRILALITNVPPLALAWGQQIVAAGSDLQISFADPTGSSVSHVDFSNQTDLRSFTAAAYDPSGSTAVVAGKNTLLTFTYSARVQSWTQQAKIEFDGLYSIPDMSWSPDGSKIAVSSVTGGLFFVTASIGSFRYKNLFEVIHITGSQLRVVDLQNKNEISLRSDYRILTTIFQQNRYVISRTTQSFIIGDTKSGKTCELQASYADGEPKITERFIFFDDQAALVWNSGELTVVEFGRPEPLQSLSTQYASPYLLSLCFNAKLGRGNSKILAYLVDSRTVKVVDLETLMPAGTKTIPNKIDWLELNVSGTMLLFRDSKRSLYIYNLVTNQLNGLLTVCSYAQWVPEANVVVAQSKKNLYVWYSPTSPDEVRVTEIDGEVTDIYRRGTKTHVTITNNGKNTAFPLDGAFIAFSAAMEGNKLHDAAKILLEMEGTSDFRSLWGQLAEAAMQANDYVIAEVSYSNVGDLSRARFIHKLNKLISENSINNPLVQARIAMLQCNFKQAEYCLIEHDQLDSAIEMYRSMHMWNELLDLAELRCPTKAQQYRDEYFQHLLNTGQYQVAARLKAGRGEISEAVDLCLQGDKPQLAADILLNGGGNVNPQLLSHVAESLIKNHRFDVAGQVYERLGKSKEALDAYRRGHSYYRALELAKATNPDVVINIEKEWADYLVSVGQNDAATMHYVESGDLSMALTCSLRAQQWQQAADILRSAGSSPELREELKPQYLRVGRHFASINDVSTAEDLFLHVDADKDLIEMYLTLGRVDDAMRRGKVHMKPAQMEQLFIETAQKMEKKPELVSKAEQIYLAINKPDFAVAMYNAIGDQQNAIRISSTYIGDKSQLEQMATKAEREGNLAAAETYYIKADAWEKAVFMYQHEKKFQDAIRIAKKHGNSQAEVKVAVHWAMDIGGDAGIKKLETLKLTEQALIYSCENGLNDIANLIMTNCKTLSKTTLQQAHLKFALALESQNKYQEAEKHYIAGDQPREAVDMYSHAKMWADAKRVAHQYGITDLPINEPSQRQVKVEGGLKGAMTLEQQGRYDDAINQYLMLTADDCGGEEQLDQVLERAVKLTINYRQNKLQDVVNSVATILLDLKRHASLGRILENIEAYPDAFEIYKAGNMWEDAARLSGYLEPDEQAQFQREYQQYLSSNKMTGNLINMGQVDAALNIYAEQGDWETCLKNAQKEGEQYLEKYTMLYAQDLVNKGKYDEAVSVLAKYQPSAKSSNIPAYLALCQSTVYAVPTYDVIKPSFYALRIMLFKVLRFAEPNAPSYTKLQNFTRAVHLLCQQSLCQKYYLQEQYSRVSLALLKYCDLIPSDFLFYKAGQIMEQQNNLEAAIVFYNTFVDISEVIHSGDISNSSSIDHTKYDQTDIPREMCLRKTLSVDDETASHVTQWVIEKSISSEFDPKIPTTSCTKCGRPVFSACLQCPYCRQNFEFCHITGFPVVNATRCTSCGCLANRTDWGLYINKTGRCPCCDAPQTAGA